jgi:hypothetical protein
MCVIWILFLFPVNAGYSAFIFESFSEIQPDKVEGMFSNLACSWGPSQTRTKLVCTVGAHRTPSYCGGLIIHVSWAILAMCEYLFCTSRIPSKESTIWFYGVGRSYSHGRDRPSCRDRLNHSHHQALLTLLGGLWSIPLLHLRRIHLLCSCRTNFYFTHCVTQ